ncbi:Zn-dependent exopeptidases superfamily protein [Euphorbia peplus]|nr:Zn-dependent exopeptidases superfamily protein [Euphorbia peplus]
MAFKLSSGDVSGFKLLFVLAIMYGVMSAIVYSILHMKFVEPLGIDAPLDRFSEARAVEHVRVLTLEGRQEGRPGLREAADYIKAQLEMIKERAGSNFRVEIEESVVNGSFNMVFLGHSISLGYRNHTNIIMRVSSADSKDDETSVLINGHYDSPLASPGAADCGSCVASMLELARLIVDSGWITPRPIIFLFNGAEELFLLGAHGFMKTYKWRDSIGASINVEASGTGGPDLVCQSGPSAFPSLVYAQSAIYPMAHSAAQDVFPVIPGDTDYRMFAQDYGDIPSLDIIFLLGGYYYHTSFDTLDKLLPGSMQARGDNLFSVLKAFTSSSKLRNAQERETLRETSDDYKDERAVFFDYLSWFMVFYSRSVALVLHSAPFAIFLLMPFSSGLYSWFTKFCDFVKGLILHMAAVILAIIFPVMFSIMRLFCSGHAMSWFAHPYLAFVMFVPCSLVGLLIPRTVWKCFPLSQNVSVLNKSNEEVSTEAWYWGTFGFYACLTLAYLVAGLSGGFLTFCTSALLLPAWIVFKLFIKTGGHQTLRSAAIYIIVLIPTLVYSVYFGGFLVQFLIEKMGMMGAVPPPYGFYVTDIIVAAIVGVVTGWCMGPLLPVCGHWLARPSILRFLLHLTIIGLAFSSRFFPYSNTAPKRVVFQHTIITSDANRIADCSYDFSVVDSNSLPFLFKHAPDVAKELQIGSDFSYKNANLSHRETWMALFPVSLLFAESLKFPASSDEIVKRYKLFPHLSNYKPHTTNSGGSRRVHLELSLGDLEEVWVAVLNITGPLSSWSFAEYILPAPEVVDGGPPSYICRLSGGSRDKWTFWLEANTSGDLKVEVAVIEQVLVEGAKNLKGLFPDWVDVTAYSGFLSTYVF